MQVSTWISTVRTESTAPPSSVDTVMGRILLVLFLFVAACGGSGGDAGDQSVDTSVPPTDPSATQPPSTELAPTTTSPTEQTTAVADAEPPADLCAHVISGEIVWQTDAATVSATVRSADTGWDKYADAWEVRAPDGRVLGVRELAHPHETEQPFTRSLAGVAIPTDVTAVVLAAHDSVDGWCGMTFTVEVPERP